MYLRVLVDEMYSGVANGRVLTKESYIYIYIRLSL